MAGQGTFRKQCLWDSGKVPLGLRATARDEKKMMQLASLRQVLSEFWVFQEKVDMKVSAFSFTTLLLIFGYL